MKMRILVIAAATCVLPSCIPSDDTAYEEDPVTTAPPYHQVTYYVDTTPGCAPTSAQMNTTKEAFAIWEDFDVTFLRGRTSPGFPIAVCFHNGPFDGDRTALTSWTMNGAKIHLRTDLDLPGQRTVLWTMAAHEMGHAIMASPAHLPDGQVGIMRSWGCSQAACGGFTDPDIALIESLGLTWDGL